MNELTVIDNTVNELMTMGEVSKEQMVKEMDRNYLASLVRANPTLAKEDFVNFITKCQLTGADPRLNQIYLIVRNAWNAQKRVSEPKGTTVFAYQFFLQKAQQTGQLESLSVDTKREPYLDLQTGRERNSITTYCTIKRRGKAEIVYPARFWEFAQTDKDGNLNGNWKSAPYLMLEKCAVANACRWAFPETLSGMYISEEMEKAIDGDKSTRRKPQEVIQQPQQRPAIEATVVSSQTNAHDSTLVDDLEDLRCDLISFIQSRSDEWFRVLEKNREDMLNAARSAQTAKAIAGMSVKAVEYDDKAQELMTTATPMKRNLLADLETIKSEVVADET